MFVGGGSSNSPALCSLATAIGCRLLAVCCRPWIVGYCYPQLRIFPCAFVGGYDILEPSPNIKVGITNQIGTHMKKPDLVEVVMKAADIEVKKQALAAVDAIFDSIVKALSKGEDVSIPGFGVFRVSKRAAREGINPRTGEKIQIPASIKPKFRAAKALKEAVQ